MSTKELNAKVAERRSLKTIIKEATNELKAVEYEITAFMEAQQEPKYFGSDYTITLKPPRPPKP